MTALFIRTGVLTLGSTQIKFAQASGAPGLKVEFHVTKNLKPEPNKVSIRVWGLADATRKALETPKTVPVQLDVGYAGDNHTIYLGQLRTATSEKDGAEVITTIASGDSEPSFSQNRVLQQIPKSATPQQIISIAAKAVTGNVAGLGNAQQAAAAATATTGGPARVVHGLASTTFGRVARSNGMEWSIQDGVMQLIPIGGYIGSSSSAVLLNSTSGMIESPTSDNKGVVKVKSLIQPGLTPGKPVVINGQLLSGTFRIEEAEYVGDTWGPDWTVQLTCKKWK